MRLVWWQIAIVCAVWLLGCSENNADSVRAKPGAISERTCRVTDGTDRSTLRYLDTIECLEDFQALASLPLDVTIPDVRAAKFMIDRFDLTDGELGRLYFQNSQLYQIHSQFVQVNIHHAFDSSNFSIN